MVSEALFRKALINLGEFSKTIGFTAAPFLTFLADKRYGIPAMYMDTITFFRVYNLYESEKGYVNPWMRNPYVNQDSCLKTVEYFRQPGGFGCWNNRDTKINCENTSCKYHPSISKIAFSCNFKRDVVWKRKNPESDYCFGFDYVNEIKKSMLNKNKIPLRDLLTVFYKNDEEINDKTLGKFRIEFKLNDIEMHEFFSQLEEPKTLFELEIGAEVSTVEENVASYMKLPETDTKPLREKVLQQLQDFAYNNGRIPQNDDHSMKFVIESAMREFGSLENALFVAGLLIEPRIDALGGYPLNSREDSETIVKVIIRLLDGNPMQFQNLCDKIKQVSGFTNSKKGTIWAAIHRTESIKSVGPRRLMVYFLEGQENLALRRLETNFEDVIDAPRIIAERNDNIPILEEQKKVDLAISYKESTAFDSNMTSLKDTASEGQELTRLITCLLDKNPLTLEEITKKVKTIPEFAHSYEWFILTTIRESEHINFIYSTKENAYLYFLEGQETFTSAPTNQNKEDISPQNISSPTILHKKTTDSQENEGKEETRTSPEVREEQEDIGGSLVEIQKNTIGNTFTREETEKLPIELNKTESTKEFEKMDQVKNPQERVPLQQHSKIDAFKDTVKVIITQHPCPNKKMMVRVTGNKEGQRDSRILRINNCEEKGCDERHEDKCLLGSIVAWKEEEEMGYEYYSAKKDNNENIESNNLCPTLHKDVKVVGTHLGRSTSKILRVVECGEKECSDCGSFWCLIGQVVIMKSREFKEGDNKEEMKLSERQTQTIEGLNNAIFRIIENNPMSLRKIKEKLQDNGKFLTVSNKDVLNVIHASKLIKRSYLNGTEVYFLSELDNLEKDP